MECWHRQRLSKSPHGARANLLQPQCPARGLAGWEGRSNPPGPDERGSPPLASNTIRYWLTTLAVGLTVLPDGQGRECSAREASGTSRCRGTRSNKDRVLPPLRPQPYGRGRRGGCLTLAQLNLPPARGDRDAETRWRRNAEYTYRRGSGEGRANDTAGGRDVAQVPLGSLHPRVQRTRRDPRCPTGTGILQRNRDSAPATRWTRTCLVCHYRSDIRQVRIHRKLGHP